ncbi:MAG: S1 RNA-binding domain-containing protein [Treponema sp.]|nr:S1 RNA-binding domain-containing protein [Treponema sp.]
MKQLYEIGQMVETKVVAISADTVFIDLGLKSEGFVDKAEFTDENGQVSIQEGDSLKVYFASASGDELHFTTKLAGQNAGKNMLESAFQNGVPVEGHVTQEIKGGYEVMVGSTRAFCPYSQMGYRERKEAAEYVGKHLTFKIQEYKNEGRNIVLSNRAILAEQAEEQKAKLAQKLQLGSIVSGTVSRLESYGAFVNIEGFEALLPISEISHVRVNDIHDVLKPGQEVKAKIIRADWAKEKVSLSMKELEADPWDGIAEKFPVGTKIEGKISRVADFGLFINLAPAVDGLVHISKLPVERNTNLKKVYKAGDSLTVTIERVDTDEKRISLSPIVSDEETDNAAEYQKAHANDDDGETYNPFAALLKK